MNQTQISKLREAIKASPLPAHSVREIDEYLRWAAYCLTHGWPQTALIATRNAHATLRRAKVIQGLLQGAFA